MNEKKHEITYEVISNITSPVDQEIADFIQRIIDQDETLATLTDTFFISYDYEYQNVYICTTHPQYLTVINYQLFKDLCDIISEYYGFSVFVKKVDSIINIKSRETDNLI